MLFTTATMLSSSSCIPGYGSISLFLKSPSGSTLTRSGFLSEKASLASISTVLDSLTPIERTASSTPFMTLPFPIITS